MYVYDTKTSMHTCTVVIWLLDRSVINLPEEICRCYKVMMPPSVADFSVWIMTVKLILSKICDLSQLVLL